MTLNGSLVHVEVVPLSEVPLAEEPSLKDESADLVLVVDDEPLVASTLAAIFEKHGFRALTAYDGNSALELARTARPKVLLSEVSMPGIDGVALAIAMARLVPECKVLLLSGKDGAAERVWSARAAKHEFDFLAKPAHPQVILKHVFTMLGREVELGG
jgi:DNA-binding response OmpR family regulator